MKKKMHFRYSISGSGIKVLGTSLCFVKKSQKCTLEKFAFQIFNKINNYDHENRLIFKQNYLFLKFKIEEHVYENN